MSKPVLVIATASDCGACHNFNKNYKADLEAELKKEDLVRLIEIGFTSWKNPFEQTVLSKWPKALVHYMQWFPNFVLFDGPTWDLAMKNISVESPLNGMILGGVVSATTGRPEQVQTQFRNDKTGVLLWIKDSIPKLQASSKNSQVVAPFDSASSSSQGKNTSVAPFVPGAGATQNPFIKPISDTASTSSASSVSPFQGYSGSGPILMKCGTRAYSARGSPQ